MLIMFLLKTAFSLAYLVHPNGINNPDIKESFLWGIEFKIFIYNKNVNNSVANNMRQKIFTVILDVPTT